MSSLEKSLAGTSTSVALAINRADSLVAKTRDQLKELDREENNSRTSGYPTPGINITMLTNRVIAEWEALKTEILDSNVASGERKDAKSYHQTVAKINALCAKLESTPIALVMLIHHGNAQALRIKHEQAAAEGEIRALRDRGYYATAASIPRPFGPLLTEWMEICNAAIIVAESDDREKIASMTSDLRNYCTQLATAPRASDLVRNADIEPEKKLRDEIIERRGTLGVQARSLQEASAKLPEGKLRKSCVEYARLIGRIPDPTRIASLAALLSYKLKCEEFCTKAIELLLSVPE